MGFSSFIPNPPFSFYFITFFFVYQIGYGGKWFKDRGQWIDGSAEPVPGMIIFFDWDNKGSSGPQDGQSDHTGIVQKVENGIVYTIEGNSGDSCRINQYSVGHYEILGYGVPQY